MEAQQIIDRALQENRVLVFSKSYCPYCHKAKRALGSVVRDPSKVTVIEVSPLACRWLVCVHVVPRHVLCWDGQRHHFIFKAVLPVQWPWAGAVCHLGVVVLIKLV